MADQVEEIKQKTDIISIIQERVDLKKSGRNFKAVCPFHSEKTPSFMVSPELQIYKCFGCGKGGDVYSFLQEYEGMDFFESLKYLAERVGVKLDTTGFKGASRKQELYKVTSLAARFYHYVLLNHKLGENALGYLTKKRGLNLKTIKTFQLGFSPEMPFAIGKYLLEKKKLKAKDLVDVGISYQARGGFVDRFRGRIIFPLFDHRGNVSGFAGRLTPESTGKDLAKYINSPETLLYNKSRSLYGLNLTRKDIKKEKKAVVVEGETDLLSSWQAGIKNIVAIKGTALTKDQARLLSRFAQEVVIALDTDMAGIEAAKRSVGVLEEEGLDMSVSLLGKYKDPDELARKSPDKLKNIIKKSVPVWDFMIDSVFTKFKGTTAKSKKNIGKETVPILASIKDDIVKAHYIQQVAKKLGVPFEAVASQVSKAGPRKSSDKEDEVLSEPKSKRREVLEEKYLGLSFNSDPAEYLNEDTKGLIKTSFARKLVEEFFKFKNESEEFTLSKFAETLPKELTPKFSGLVLVSGEDDNQSVIENELELLKRELKILDIRENLKKLEDNIKRYEKNKQSKKLEDTENRFVEMVRKLKKLEAGGKKGIIL